MHLLVFTTRGILVMIHVYMLVGVHSVMVSHQICGNQISEAIPLWLTRLISFLTHVILCPIARPLCYRLIMLLKVPHKAWRFSHASLVFVIAVALVAVGGVAVLRGSSGSVLSC